MSLSSMLPAPRGQYEVYSDARLKAPVKKTFNVPPYLHRQGFVPRSQDDFGDGGAFPEVHIAQYPLHMGEPGKKSQAVVAVGVGADGGVDHTAIVKQNRGKQKVHASFSDLVEKRVDEADLARPSAEEELAATMRTRAALEGIVNRKIAVAKPVTLPQEAAAQARANTSQFIRYTPAANLAHTNSGAKQRIIRLVEAPVDPMEPPRYKHKKVPRGPGDDPVPVMHSPPRKVSVADQKMWTIPPCVSNWKNAKGYTIPLDKRVAADGRSLQETTINSSFAKLSEALYIAEREARMEVETRSKVQRKLAMKEKEQKEEELRKAASMARMERSGAPDMPSGKSADGDAGDDDDDISSSSGSESEGEDGDDARAAAGGGSSSRGRGGGRDRDRSDDRAGETAAEAEARRARDRLRRERRREHEREMRLEKAGKRTKASRAADRDVSEKIALGMHTATQGGEQYDARLFNQSAGMSAGFGQDDDYNVYSKPLFGEKAAKSVYRPRGNDDAFGNADEQFNKLKNTSRFKPEKDFEGVDRTKQRSSGPVQFEKAEDTDLAPTDNGDAAAFAAMGTASKKRKTLEAVGGGGTMRATGGLGIHDSTGATAGTTGKIAFASAKETSTAPPGTRRDDRSGDRGRDTDRDSRRRRDDGDDRSRRRSRRSRSRSRSPRRRRSRRSRSASRSRSRSRHRRRR